MFTNQEKTNHGNKLFVKLLNHINTKTMWMRQELDSDHKVVSQLNNVVEHALGNDNEVIHVHAYAVVI